MIGGLSGRAIQRDTEVVSIVIVGEQVVSIVIVGVSRLSVL